MSGVDCTVPPGLTAVPTARELARIRHALLRAASVLWRDLPWRETRDPWWVLVSEVMLQQTQASRVVEPFRRFVRRFPDPSVCASAGSAEVVRAWAGLGYNRRALNLHRTAGVLVEHYAGKVPDRLDALLALPGIGPYTARAILAFAYEQPVGVVDTNVSRVLARAVIGRPLRPGEAQPLADRLVPDSECWRFNQALFDLGARCCTARLPRCAECPLASCCRWNRARVTAPFRAANTPDPASAGLRRQSTFAGSEREGRGRLVDALRVAPVPSSTLARAAGWPDDETRAARVAAALVEEGLAFWRGSALVLG